MVFEKVRKIIVDVIGLEEDEITLESRFIDDLGADLFVMVEIVIDVEEEFDIDIPDEEVMKISTVGEMVEYVKENM